MWEVEVKLSDMPEGGGIFIVHIYSGRDQAIIFMFPKIFIELHVANDICSCSLKKRYNEEQH